MKNGKKVIIIGGGIAGLSAGIHAQMDGFETEIYESHFNLVECALPGLAAVTKLITAFTGFPAAILDFSFTNNG